MLKFENGPERLRFEVRSVKPANRYAYAANVGWLDARGDTADGAVIGEYVCSGNIYSANAGWINLGGGAPANQIQYQNNSATDLGVNTDGTGRLTGYAYGANVGWVNFEQTYGQPRVDLFTGKLSGSVWSANCGWISLSNAFAFVQTTNIQKGALAPNGLPIAWLRQNFGTININAGADADGDGVSNGNEYLADTDPNDANSVLRITSFQRGNFGDPTRIDIMWNSVPTRYYAIQFRPQLGVGSWSDWVVFPWAGANNAAFDDTGTNEFYRIRAFRPLTP